MVRGVSFEIGRGEWLAVTGPNGCGKSTLGLAAAGLWPVSRGSIEVAGAPLEPTAGRRAFLRIAAVLQEPASQLFERRVSDEIAFAARNLGAGASQLAARVSEWSARFGLEGLLDRDPQTLSAGWQQRVLLAAAMASDPELIVVDEGAAHMDPQARAHVLREIRAAVSAGLAVLWVTQDPGEAAAADRILRLGSDGRAVRDPGAHILDVPREHPAGESPWCMPRTAASARVLIGPWEGADERRIVTSGPFELELAAGSPVALVGPNGSGKTVALEAIAGLVPSRQVSVLEAVSGPHSPVLAAQFPELQVFGETVAEELCYGPVARGSSPAAVRDSATQLLAELGLDSKIMDCSTWSLSAGERRLVQAAAALLTPASRVLIDEPTCGLDPDHARRLAGVLARLGQRVPLMIATQDPWLPGFMGARERHLGN